MATQLEAVRQLLDRAVGELGSADWSIAGGNQLRATLGDDVEGVILPLVAGCATYTVSIIIGPRFPAIEWIVAKASRAAGQPEAGIQTSAKFPTVFQNLSSLSSVPDQTPLTETQSIVDALRTRAVPFIKSLSAVGDAADYASTNSLAYGLHALRIPVLLAKAGRRREAENYLDQQTDDRSLYSAFMKRYREAVIPLL